MTGGSDGSKLNWGYLDTTELLRQGRATSKIANIRSIFVDSNIDPLLPGASGWTFGPRLPRAVKSVKAINAGGKIYLAGGDDIYNRYQDEVKYKKQNVSPNTCILNTTYLMFDLCYFSDLQVQ